MTRTLRTSTTTLTATTTIKNTPTCANKNKPNANIEKQNALAKIMNALAIRNCSSKPVFNETKFDQIEEEFSILEIQNAAWNLCKINLATVLTIY